MEADWMMELEEQAVFYLMIRSSSFKNGRVQQSTGFFVADSV